MAEHLQVMISSTARDLPEHRKEAMDACLRQGMFPIMMEHLPASDEEAIPASLRMVDEADIYLLILAHRYGYVPKTKNQKKISVTEHEYNRALKRKIPILTFAMHDDHPVKAADVEKGDGAVKLEAFKKRALLKVTNFFTSPADLRAHVISSLSQRREPDLTTFHYVSDIPAPPAVFIAHPYTLLQTHTLIGRQKELKLLTDWITGKELEFDGLKAQADSVRIMSVVAIGGMGKSALTWKWFNDVAPQEMKNLAGRLWWSFYESDATFENFVIRALAYVTKRSIQDVTQIPALERERQLLAELDHEPFLFVLDGLERILIAYARMDAARLDDSEVGKEKNLRKTADPRVGSFLKRLATVKHSRVLVSSRLYPTELETPGRDPIPGSFRVKIEGLTDEDAVELWRAFGVMGARDELLQIFRSVDKHPLLIQTLAGEVKRYRRAPTDFDEWRKVNPLFDPARFSDLNRAMAHVLGFALRKLDKRVVLVLHTIAAFRMPARYDSLVAILVGNSLLSLIYTSNSGRCADEQELDRILAELEDRGLVGWDKRANRYDLHPIVRGVVWNSLSVGAKRRVYKMILRYLESLPESNYQRDSRFEDFASIIESYNALIGLRRYSDALKLVRKHLELPILFGIGDDRLWSELLEMLAPDWLPWPRGLFHRGIVLTLLGDAQVSSQPRKAEFVFKAALRLAERNLRSWDPIHLLARRLRKAITGRDPWSHNVAATLLHLCISLRLLGRLRESETAICQSIAHMRRTGRHADRAAPTGALGISLAYRGEICNGLALLRQSENELPDVNTQIESKSCIVRVLLWQKDYDAALELALQTQQTYRNKISQRGWMPLSRLIAEAAIELGDFASAEENTASALIRVRGISNIEELRVVVVLAELRRRQGNLKLAREFLDGVWELAARGPFPLFHSDALNVLTQIERDEGNRHAAIEAATKAYQLAWCDGPPFAYHWGLEKAKHHLKELDAREPEMPPFDESKFEPMPEVEINPRDEFYVNEELVS